MTLTKFDVLSTFQDERKNQFTLIIAYRRSPWRKSRLFQFSVPRDILDDIGAKELASRIYSVFKQHISRPASE